MYDDIITAASQMYAVPISWIKAVINVESSWVATAVNTRDPSGAWGLMQVLFTTAQGYGYAGEPEGLKDPATNIDLGSHLLGDLRAKYGDDFRRVYSAYNSGSADLWEKSAQVAANVQRALQSLQQYITEDVQALVATNDTAPGSLAGIVVAVLLLAWLGWRGR